MTKTVMYRAQNKKLKNGGSRNESVKEMARLGKMEARLDAYCERLNNEYEALVKEKGVRRIEATAAFYRFIGALEARHQMVYIYYGL